LSAIPAGVVFNEPNKGLIADDDITSINFFKKPLEDAGYKVVMANDGNEAKISF
jgi:CheY-like chemotaxis protein